MDFFSAMKISSTGLSVQRTRMNVTSSNLANIETTRTEEGGAYRRRSPVVAAVPLAASFEEIFGDTIHEQTHGAEVVSIEQDTTPGRLVHDPDHPDANDQGYVEMPNVNAISEMGNMLTASRSYEANVSALKALKGMAQSALEIGD